MCNGKHPCSSFSYKQRLYRVNKNFKTVVEQIRQSCAAMVSDHSCWKIWKISASYTYCYGCIWIPCLYYLGGVQLRPPVLYYRWRIQIPWGARRCLLWGTFGMISGTAWLRIFNNGHAAVLWHSEALFQACIPWNATISRLYTYFFWCTSWYWHWSTSPSKSVSCWIARGKKDSMILQTICFFRMCMFFTI